MSNFQGTDGDDSFNPTTETRGFAIAEADIGVIQTFGGRDRVHTTNYGTYTIDMGSGPDTLTTFRPIIWDDFRTEGGPDRILISSFTADLGRGHDILNLWPSQGSFNGGAGIDTLRVSTPWEMYGAFGRTDRTFLEITGEDQPPAIYVDLKNGIVRSSGWPALNIATGPGADNPWSFSGTPLAAFDVVVTGFENITTAEGDDTLLGGNAVEEVFSPGLGINTVNGRGGLDWLQVVSSPDGNDVKLDLEAGTALGFDGETTTFSNIERFALGFGSDTVLGSAGDDYVVDGIAYAQNGRLIGGAGEDQLLLLSLDAMRGLDLRLDLGRVDILDAPEGLAPGTTELFGWELITLTDLPDKVRGSTDGDQVFGQGGKDRMLGLQGMDTLWGGNAKDVLLGHAGKDLLYGDDGGDILKGGAHSDTLVGGKGADAFFGGSGGGLDEVDYSLEEGLQGIHVTLASDSAVDTYGTTDSGFSGIEIIRGTDLGDRILGNDEDNIFYAGRADGDSPDELRGRLGNDTMYGETGVNGLYGDGGDDSLIGGNAKDFLYGGGENDDLDGRNGNDVIEGGGGDDDITLSAGRDQIDGGGGDRDRIYFTPTTTVDIETPNLLNKNGVRMDLDADTYRLGNFGRGTLENVEIFIGTEGHDTLHTALASGAVDETLRGGNGNDGLSAGRGDDLLEGGSGDDGLSGDQGDDRLYGDARPGSVAASSITDGQDDLSGGRGNDTLHGGGKGDILRGGEGDDVLDGGLGPDILTGGRDEDVFHFSPGKDVITDFSKDYNTVDFQSEPDTIAIYGGTYTPGFADYPALRAAAFQSGSDVVIPHAQGTLTLEGMQVSALAASMFDFT